MTVEIHNLNVKACTLFGKSKRHVGHAHNYDNGCKIRLMLSFKKKSLLDCFETSNFRAEPVFEKIPMHVTGECNCLY